MTQTTDRPADAVHEVDLAITGMTCASCSARIEKKLGRLDGVDAVVNLATEKATVRFAEPVTVEQVLSTVRATGYGAEVVGETPPAPRTDSHESHLDPPGHPRGRPQAAGPGRGGAHRAGRRAGDGARHPPRQQRVGAARARDAGRALVRPAVPPRDLPERAPRRLDDGHAGVDRRAHRLPVVGRRRPHGSRRRHGQRHGCRWGSHRPPLVRGRDGRDHLPAPRALDGGARDRPHP